MTAATQPVRLTQVHDYQFDADFGGERPPLRLDEPAPLGQGTGPSPVQLLASAVGSCLSEAQAEVGRSPEGRLRVLSMQVTLTVGVPADTLEHLDRVLATFEDYCTVTQSVSQAFPVKVSIFDLHGTRLK